MTSKARLQGFLDDCTAVVRPGADPSDIVQEIAPLMLRLLAGGADFLKPEHFRADPTHYARNLVHAAADDSLSLFTLVWLPGQMTPVHDHGTWGVVGVVEGVLMEQSYMRLDPEPQAARDSGIELRRGGLSLLTSGTVSTFGFDLDTAVFDVTLTADARISEPGIIAVPERHYPEGFTFDGCDEPDCRWAYDPDRRQIEYWTARDGTFAIRLTPR